MRLTNYHRKAFVKAVLADVPTVDYEAQMRSVFDAAQLEWAKNVSPVLAGMLKDASLRGFLSFSSRRVPQDGPTIEWFNGLAGFHSCVPARVLEEMRRLAKLSEEQGEMLATLRAKVEGAINACTTVKVAKQRLPEFEKYLPKETDAPSHSVPVIADLVSDLVKAGWPQGKVPA